MSAQGEIDIASPEVYERGIPHEAFAHLRAYDPVHWHRWDNSRGGFWAITRHADVATVTRDWETFISGEHVNLWELDAQAQEARRSLIESDGIAHRRLRRLVAPPFQNKRSGDYIAATRDITVELLSELVSQRDVDLVPTLSEPLPIRVIVSILGIPDTDTDFLVHLSNQLVEGTSDRVVDPTAYGNTTPLEHLPFNSPAAFALFDYGRRIGTERREVPTSDVISRLVHAEIEGDRLTDAEYCNFFQLLVFAGNETTRTAISNGLLAFMENPSELERLHADPSLIPSAVEEILRYATPVLHMRRTASRDVELGGKHIAKGDWLVLWYPSANFDDTVFPDPQGFDIGRPVKPEHQAFGAVGPHHCLGAPLARLEIRILLEEIVRLGLRFEQTGDVVRTRSNFVNGILSLPCRIRSTS
jgi:cytochrome P450